LKLLKLKLIKDINGEISTAFRQQRNRLASVNISYSDEGLGFALVVMKVNESTVAANRKNLWRGKPLKDVLMTRLI